MTGAISESELIVTSSGAIYHLDLVPSELSDIVITVGAPERVAKVTQYFDYIELKKQHREFIIHTGTFGGKRITVLSTGMGAGCIDIVLNELDALINIDFKTRMRKTILKRLDIIRIGTAGSLHADIPLDSFVLAEYGFGLDGIINFYQQEITPDQERLLKMFNTHLGDYAHTINPYISSAAEPLVDVFKERCIQGIAASCIGFYGPQNRMLRAQHSMPDLMKRLQSFSHEGHRIVKFEMETASLYGLSQLLDHRCVSLSAIVADRANNRFSRQMDKTIDGLIQYVLERISGCSFFAG